MVDIPQAENRVASRSVLARRIPSLSERLAGRHGLVHPLGDLERSRHVCDLQDWEGDCLWNTCWLKSSAHRNVSRASLAVGICKSFLVMSCQWGPKWPDVGPQRLCSPIQRDGKRWWRSTSPRTSRTTIGRTVHGTMRRSRALKWVDPHLDGQVRYDAGARARPIRVCLGIAEISTKSLSACALTFHIPPLAKTSSWDYPSRYVLLTDGSDVHSVTS